MATMTGHLMGQMFTCCMLGDDQNNVRPRPRIDRSMIGNPTDFRHTGHIGTSDMLNSNAQSNEQNKQSDNVGLLQNQMMSKGGYSDYSNSVPHIPHIINARSLDEVRRQ